MMPGFVQVDCHTFYTVYWPQIKRGVEAEAKRGLTPFYGNA